MRRSGGQSIVPIDMIFFLVLDEFNRRWRHAAKAQCCCPGRRGSNKIRPTASLAVCVSASRRTCLSDGEGHSASCLLMWFGAQYAAPNRKLSAASSVETGSESTHVATASDARVDRHGAGWSSHRETFVMKLAMEGPCPQSREHDRGLVDADGLLANFASRSTNDRRNAFRHRYRRHEQFVDDPDQQDDDQHGDDQAAEAARPHPAFRP